MSADVSLSTNAIPLILGVTGHRDLARADHEALKHCVGKIFTDLRQAYPQTPLVLLSPLVEGADRLAAEAALEAGAGVSLAVVLPWRADVGECDPCRLDDRQAFQGLLAKAAQVLCLPLPEGVSCAQLARDSSVREYQFDQVGKFIAGHSQILLALWDGTSSTDSGTTKVINWQREGVLAPLAARGGILDVAEPGAVFHVVAPREDRARQPAALSVNAIWPNVEQRGSAAEEDLRRIWANIDRFNLDLLETEQRHAAAIESSQAYVVPLANQLELPTHLRRLLAWYGRADAASLYYQKRTLRSTWVMLAGAFAAITALESYAHFVSFWPLMVFHLLLLLAGFQYYRHVQRQAFQPRYLDYRALAEALRVQLFWRWAGVADAVADHYLRHFRGELDWIRTATRTCFLMSGAHDSSGSDAHSASALQRIDQVRHVWVEEQRKYFTRRGPQEEHRHERLEHWAQYAFRAAIAIAMVVIATEWYFDHPSHFLLLLLFLALVVSAMLEDYNDYRAHALHSRRYHWMQQLYATADARLDQALQRSDLDSARGIIRELGQEALAENADWLIQHRDRLPIWHGG